MTAYEKIAALQQIHDGYTDLKSTWEDEPTGTGDNVGMRRTQTDIGLAPWVTRVNGVDELPSGEDWKPVSVLYILLFETPLRHPHRSTQ